MITIMDDGAGHRRRRACTARRWSAGILKGDETLSEREAVQLIFSQGFSTAGGRHRPLGPRGRPRRGAEVHRAAERPDRGGDGAGRGHQVHHPAAADAGHHLRAHGGGGGPHLRGAAVARWWRACAWRRARSTASTAARPCASASASCPLLRLAGLFGLPEAADDGARRYVVIVGRGDKRVGLVVDRLRGQQEVVIKAARPRGHRRAARSWPGPPSWATAGWC